MALKLNIQSTQFGIPAPQAYAKITNFFGNKDQVQVQVSVYYDEAARADGRATILDNAHYFNMDELQGDFIPAVYEALKQLEQYAGAEDC